MKLTYQQRKARQVVPAFGTKGCICKFHDPGFDGRHYEPAWYGDPRCPINHKPKGKRAAKLKEGER